MGEGQSRSTTPPTLKRVRLTSTHCGICPVPHGAQSGVQTTYAPQDIANLFVWQSNALLAMALLPAQACHNCGDGGLHVYECVQYALWILLIFQSLPYFRSRATTCHMLTFQPNSTNSGDGLCWQDLLQQHLMLISMALQVLLGTMFRVSMFSVAGRDHVLMMWENLLTPSILVIVVCLLQTFRSFIFTEKFACREQACDELVVETLSNNVNDCLSTSPMNFEVKILSSFFEIVLNMDGPQIQFIVALFWAAIYLNTQSNGDDLPYSNGHMAKRNDPLNFATLQSFHNVLMYDKNDQHLITVCFTVLVCVFSTSHEICAKGALCLRWPKRTQARLGRIEMQRVRLT